MLYFVIKGVESIKM